MYRNTVKRTVDKSLSSLQNVHSPTYMHARTHACYVIYVCEIYSYKVRQQLKLN